MFRVIFLLILIVESHSYLTNDKAYKYYFNVYISIIFRLILQEHYVFDTFLIMDEWA